MRRIRKIATFVLVISALAVGLLIAWGHLRRHPEDLPWTKLDLAQPIGAFTGRKLADLADDGGTCLSLLGNAGVAFQSLPPLRQGESCGYTHAVRLRPGGALGISWRPDSPGTNCAVAAGLALWEWHVVQPAALEHFGQPVKAIRHYGSYSCRRLYGRSEGVFSEHASANAVDVAAFVLADGTLVGVEQHWNDEGPRAAFLRQVRDGACDLFATVLSPDYNEAHRDHLHFDQAQRGRFGWRGCR